MAAKGSTANQPGVLELVREAKISELLSGRRDKRYEASGVHLKAPVQDYLLGMCEGNACKSGSAGREPG